MDTRSGSRWLSTAMSPNLGRDCRDFQQVGRNSKANDAHVRAVDDHPATIANVKVSVPLPTAQGNLFSAGVAFGESVAPRGIATDASPFVATDVIVSVLPHGQTLPFWGRRRKVIGDGVDDRQCVPFRYSCPAEIPPIKRLYQLPPKSAPEMT
jgi:hypothetical protein